MRKKWMFYIVVVVMCVFSFSIVVEAGLGTYLSKPKGSDFTNRSTLASKLDYIFAGNSSIYSDNKLTKLVNTALGSKSVPNNNIYMYVGEKNGKSKATGTSCWIYGNGVYYTLFKETVGNGTAGKNSEKLNVGSNNKLTYANLQKWGVRKEPGAYIRVGTHTIILLGYDSSSLTYLSGNDDGKGLVQVVKEYWNNVANNANLKGIVGHIIQPKQVYYDSLYPSCSHDSYYTSQGRCKKCSAWAPYASASVTTGTYKVSNGKTAYMRVHPYNVSDETIGELVETISSGKQVKVTGGVKNYFGNIWYEVSYGGKKGFIFSGNLTFVSAENSTLAIKPTKSTYSMKKGAVLDIAGSITSNYKITSVTATLEGHSPYQYANFNPNSTSVNIGDYSSGKLNSFKAQSLSSGTHKLTITAKDSQKTVSYTISIVVTDSAAPATYTVSFNSNGGSAVSSISRTAGSTIGSLSTPTRTGYSFDGWYTSASGGSKISTSTTVTGNVTYYAHWTANTYDVNVMLYAWGLQKQEGNTTDKNGRHLGTTILKKSYDSSFTITDGTYSATVIPRGFKQSDIFGTSDYAGVWTSYKKGQSYIRQPAANTHIQVDCSPVTYKITYNLNGGINAASNPSTYNVLYGVTFAKPTRAGYEFTGWTNSSGQTVTGINPGANASHSSAQDLINKLSGRTIGDQVVTANWKAKRLPGDVNDDGTVSLLDLVRLCKYLAGYNVQIHEANSNVNGDSTVSLLDLVRLCKYLAGYDVELK